MNSSKSKLIIIFGPNGVGKGTQSEKISKDFGYFHLNMGSLLREWVKKRNHGEYRTMMNDGEFLPDEIVDDAICEQLGDKQLPNTILEGYPRRKSQIDNMERFIDKYGLELIAVIVIDAPLDIILERLTQRVQTPDGKVYHLIYNPPPKDYPEEKLIRREDDRPEIVRKRYNQFMKTTLECINHPFFEDVPIYRIDGTKGIDKVYSDIREFLLSKF